MMLVEINLLPKKEAKNKTFLIFAIILIVVLFIGSILFYLHWDGKKDELKRVQNDLSLINGILDVKRASINDYESSDSYAQLNNAIKWAETQPFDLVMTMQKLIKALPERGFIADFDMSEDYVINVQIQFDTKSEAAYYLNNILKYEWIDEAVISEAKTAESINEEIAGEELDLEELVPRYLAKYELRLNVNKVKEEFKNIDEEEGGDTP